MFVKMKHLNEYRTFEKKIDYKKPSNTKPIMNKLQNIRM